MAFDTFDEGIALGGLRSKQEIKVLICYIFNSVKESITKSVILEAIMEHELANFFEVSVAFDELIETGNLEEDGEVDGEAAYSVTENGKVVAEQLESMLSYSVKEKALCCALELLGQKRTARENTVEITKQESGYEVKCRVSGGDLDLLSFTLYAPDEDQAEIIKKSFLSYPTAVYKTMLALMTQNREAAGEALEAVYGLRADQLEE